MKGWLTKKVESLAGRVGYETERLMLQINEQIVGRMHELKLSRSALAEKLGKDRSQVTRLLNGNPNVTIKTLAEISCALGSRWDVQLADRKSKWTSANQQFFEVEDWLVYVPVTVNASCKAWTTLHDAWREYSSIAHLTTSANVVASNPSKNIVVRPEFKEVVN